MGNSDRIRVIISRCQHTDGGARGGKRKRCGKRGMHSGEGSVLCTSPSRGGGAAVLIIRHTCFFVCAAVAAVTEDDGRGSLLSDSACCAGVVQPALKKKRGWSHSSPDCCGTARMQRIPQRRILVVTMRRYMHERSERFHASASEIDMRECADHQFSNETLMRLFSGCDMSQISTTDFSDSVFDTAVTVNV